MIDKLQEKWREEWLSSSKRAILFLSPRTGKTKASLDIAEEVGARKILVAMPRNDIQQAWERERKGREIDLEYTTFRSLEKHLEGEYSLIIMDEIHEGSDKLLETLSKFPQNIPIIGLTGTMTHSTEANILKRTGLYVCSRYTIEEAVRDGVICDYEINVHKIPLIGEEKTKFEKLYSKYKWAKGSFKNLISLQLIGMLQKSPSKLTYTKELIQEYSNERLLIFCGQTEIADQLGIPVYHSKQKEKQIFDDFCEGKGDHLACVKLIQAGITIKPINRGIINYNSGASEDCAQKICRFLGKELYFPDKKAQVEFLCIDHPFSMWRVETALNLFEQSKISYV